VLQKQVKVLVQIPLLLVHKKKVLNKEEMLILKLKETMLPQVVVNKETLNKVVMPLRLKEIIPLLSHNKMVLNKVESQLQLKDLLMPLLEDLLKDLLKDQPKMLNRNILIDNLIYSMHDCDVIGYYFVLFHYNLINTNHVIVVFIIFI
jgi:hypothetical protein